MIESVINEKLLVGDLKTLTKLAIKFGGDVGSATSKRFLGVFDNPTDADKFSNQVELEGLDDTDTTRKGTNYVVYVTDD